MWDLTPDTDLLMELPEEYNFETALADLIVSFCDILWFQFGCVDINFVVSNFSLLYDQDNSLQAVWSNSVNERRLIRYIYAPLLLLKAFFYVLFKGQKTNMHYANIWVNLATYET